jgi:GTP-binding protein
MFRIALIGRPNVGKSTLFNKLVGKRFAITNNQPGVTRDRKESRANLGDIEFIAIDTAGMDNEAKKNSLSERMLNQTMMAISEADLCLFMVDGKAGILHQDRELAKILKKHHQKYLLVINKFEGKNEEILGKEYYQIGLGYPLAISAEHKDGFNVLYERMLPFYNDYQQNYQKNFDDIILSNNELNRNIKTENDDNDDNAKNTEDHLTDDKSSDKATILQIAIVGRPNAGKSTLLNKIINKDRLLTGPEAGITRDSIAIDFEFGQQKIRFIDTAGIRKKALINDALEKMSVLDSMRAIEFAQVVILLIDASIALDKQDLAIASHILKEGRVLIFAINKIDEIKGDKEQFMKQIRIKLQEIFAEISGAPIIAISAISGYNINKMLNFALASYQQWQSYIPTRKLYQWLESIKYQHSPKMVQGRDTKLKYITQIKKRPPTFAVFTNHIEAVEGDYQRYLTNKLRVDFNLNLTPIRIVIRKSENPFENKVNKKSKR